MVSLSSLRCLLWSSLLLQQQQTVLGFQSHHHHATSRSISRPFAVASLHQSSRSAATATTSSASRGNTKSSPSPTVETSLPKIGSSSSSSSSRQEQFELGRTQQAAEIEANFEATTTVSPPTVERVSEEEYQRGLVTIGFCTLVFASMSPAMHAVLALDQAPPVLLLNAAVSVVAFLGLLLAGPWLENWVPPPSTLQQQQQPGTAAEEESSDMFSFLDTKTKAGLELGLWKSIGTTANLYGLSLTTADHGAFLIQLTTLIVPAVQGIMGVPIPRRIQTSIALALGGVALFTQDSAAAAGSSAAAMANDQAVGDLWCVVAAAFYATYDLRLFRWGKRVAPRDLMTRKIGTQALCSLLLLVGAGGLPEATAYVSQAMNTADTTATAATPVMVWALIAWSGLMVNAVVPFLQVSGQQAIGPTRSQTIYASQPLWAAVMSFFFLGETVGVQGVVGGGAFLAALFLAATAETPDPNCGKEQCEV